MDNKKIDLLFGLVVIAFLGVTIFLIKDFNAKRVSDYKDYVATVTNIVKMKNDKIRILSNRLVVEQRQNEDLRNTLADTRNDLEGLTKKLIQPAPVAVPVAVPVAAPAPAAAVAAPATASK